MYSTDVHEGGTASATDDERLPPGGFSLRHGFPHWFGRGNRNGPAEDQKSHDKQMLTTPKPVGHATMITPESAGKVAAASYTKTSTSHVSAYDILKYIRGTFDDEELLDAVPLEAAGNPGAWHAWRTHRRKLGKIRDEPVKDQDGADGAASNTIEEDIPASAPDQDAKATSQSTARKPGEWNWEGVWEDRVRKGVQASLSESVLYGGATALPDELVSRPPLLCESLLIIQIKFLPLDESEVDSVKENIRRTLGAST
ncbi:Protein crossbronx-like protein [Emericellopsis cladophorae]|uniref:Protein crossbronx-like protein n=1 Tax=Emericellopsis cladophorae TaxID=2686198 RepID=A0A9P9Y7M3_9HYPO|nr:Protein crossbronx-like protein [Emericellopsis cladophorae]KAI6785128.1 Protein crossbronx-like protein [Emericellopsis cladophorae]